ncbi:MAG TPA: replication-relaxation family protein [Anaeromyxobacteraceae bacterium]|nr:replication-relaxation family protein [Anaeromyxobacteraceae bacterium]
MSRQAASSRVVLTPRDTEVLGSLAEYRYLTVSQLERLHFASAQTARRRLRLLAQAELLKLIEVATIPERVAALTSSGAESLAAHTGTSAEATNGRAQNPLFLQHHLAAAEFRVRLAAACRARTELKLAGYLPEHLTRPAKNGQPSKYLRDDVPPSGGDALLAHTPDGVFALERAGQLALFFLEIDCGTEVLGSPDHGVGKLVRFYLRYLVSGRFQRYRTDFGASADFRGFRTLLVTTSAQRLENIRQRCGRIAFDPPAAKRFVWLATEDLLTEGDPLTSRWVSLDPTDSAAYTIAPSEQQEGERSWPSS